MAHLNTKYGSELHLLRYLGRHRHALHKHIETVVPGRVIDWIDFRFHARKMDSEWIGLDFLPDYLKAKERWKTFWPQTGNEQNWDAVGWVEVNSHAEVLLVEAKANVEELQSGAAAKEHGGLPTIRRAFEETKAAMNVPARADWLSPYYQYCNRLATLHYLTENGIASRLLFMHFCGDCTPDRTCPGSMEEWRPHIQRMHEHIGLTGGSHLEQRIHHIFIPISSAKPGPGELVKSRTTR